MFFKTNLPISFSGKVFNVLLTLQRSKLSKFFSNNSKKLLITLILLLIYEKDEPFEPLEHISVFTNAIQNFGSKVRKQRSNMWMQKMIVWTTRRDAQYIWFIYSTKERKGARGGYIILFTLHKSYSRRLTNKSFILTSTKIAITLQAANKKMK